MLGLLPLAVDDRLNNPFVSPKMFVFTVGVCAVAFLRILKFDRLKIPTPVAILAFLVLVNSIWQINPYYGHRQVFWTLGGLFLFLEVSQNPSWRRYLLFVMVMGGVLASFEVYLNFCDDSAFLKRALGMAGTIGNPNYVAAYMLYPIAACVAMRGWFLLALLTLIPGLILSHGRAGWLGFAAGMFLYLYFILPKQRRLYLLCSLFVAVSLPALLFTYHPKALDPTTLLCRLKYWQAGWEMVKENPVLGAGFDSYRNGVYKAQQRIIAKDPGWWEEWYDKKPRRCHNVFIESACDGGIVFFVALWGCVAGVLSRSYHRGRRDLTTLALWCGVIAVLVNGMFFFTAKNVVTWTYFWVFLGLINGKEVDGRTNHD